MERGGNGATQAANKSRDRASFALTWSGFAPKQEKSSMPIRSANLAALCRSRRSERVLYALACSP